MGNEFDDWEKFARGEEDEVPKKFGFEIGAYEDEDLQVPLEPGMGLSLTDTDHKSKAKHLPKTDGNFFSMSDLEHRKRPQISMQERQRLKEAKKGFMDKARDFMDTTPLGEGQHLLNRFLGKSKPPEATDPDPPEEDDWEGDIEEEYDYDDPETIHVGYLKPGTKDPTRRKTLEEAREESFDLKMGGLANLLSRFGAEAEPEVKVKPEVKTLSNKAPLRATCQTAMATLEAALQDGIWEALSPLTLHLLLQSNEPALVLNFMFLSLFAPTPENYMARSDLAHLCDLAACLEFPFEAADIENHISQLFLFPERIFELAEDLAGHPLQVDPAVFQDFKAQVAQACLDGWAKQNHLAADLWGPHLAGQWQKYQHQLLEFGQVLEKEQQHYQTFQQRGLSSPTVFAKVLKAEVDVMVCFQHMQALAQQLTQTEQCLLLLQEEETLTEIQTLDYAAWSPLPLNPQPTFTQLSQALLPPHPAIPAWQMWVALPADEQTSELSPANQKRVISHAKLGDIPSLKLVYQYKAAKIQSTLQQLQQNPLY